MKFEESALTRYLVKNLEPLTEADPVILAEYVAALLKKDKPIKELEKLCVEKLLEFLGQGTKPFIAKLFQALEDGSVVAPARSLNAIEQVAHSPSLIAEDQTEIELKTSALKREELSPSGSPSDEEEKEITDDDDDDRNHKHRRRENRSQSYDKDMQGQHLRRPNRKRNKPFENGQIFLGNDPQPSDRDFSTKFEKRRPGFAARPCYDTGLRARGNQAFRGDPNSRFDISTPLGRLPTGRGRGRGSVPWSQHELKFSSVDTFDFSSQMTPQGPSLFAGRGMQSFGLIPGMPNGGLDTLHPLGLQVPINQSFNIGLPRQRCRDFEERGFCLRGDMCPMEHGVRIVVEDVQSLSQFNLPVSLPSAHLLGTPAGAGALPLSGGPSSLLTNSKPLHGKSKPGLSDDCLGLNRVPSSAAGAGEADLYDPDQPLWNNNHPETSSALMGLSSPKIDDAEPLWNDDPSGRQNFRLSDGFDSAHPGRSIAGSLGSQSTSSSVWGRIGNSGNRLDMTGKFDSTVASVGCFENETKEQDEGLAIVPGIAHQKKRIASEDAGPKAINSAATPRLRNEPVQNIRRTSQKALRTLFVNGIPLKNNKRDALLSHFCKFGEVIDIYIPLNSERAFVQFSKREEAEAALKAPDAVMGNRFIKLWWANRDSIPDNTASTGRASSAVPSVAASVPSQASVCDRGKESHPSVGLKVTAATSSDVHVPAVVLPRPVLTNGPKATPPSQKKLENLELLKEEIRLKQEMLDQKRNDFRRQLDKLEKKAITVKGEATSEQSVKRHKGGVVTDDVKAATPKSMDPVTAGHRLGVEKTFDKEHSGETTASPSSKTNSTLALRSPKSLKHQTRASMPLGGPFVVNRFKLDNRPSTFRVLPPLPADFANVGILREHFSSFGELSAVELEDHEANVNAGLSEPSKHCSARVTFTTRSSAERAFSNAKCWQGHALKFSWVIASSNSSNGHSGRENFPTPTLRGPPEAEDFAEMATSGSSSTTGKSTCIVSQEAGSTGNGEPENSEVTKGVIEPVDLLEMCPVSQTALSSCEPLSCNTETRLMDEGPHINNVQ